MVEFEVAGGGGRLAGFAQELQLHAVRDGARWADGGGVARYADGRVDSLNTDVRVQGAGRDGLERWSGLDCARGTSRLELARYLPRDAAGPAANQER